MTFEWDEAKNAANKRKHGLGFETARAVFHDPLALLRRDPGTHTEERWQIIGRVRDLLVVIVVFVVRDEASEVYRLVSARRVTAHERKEYEAR